MRATHGHTIRVFIAFVLVLVVASVLRRRDVPTPASAPPSMPFRDAQILRGLAALPESLPPLIAFDVRVQLLDLQGRDASRLLVAQSRHAAAPTGVALPWTLAVPAGQRPADDQLLLVITVLDGDHVRFVASPLLSSLSAAPPSISPVTPALAPVISLRRAADPTAL